MKLTAEWTSTPPMDLTRLSALKAIWVGVGRCGVLAKQYPIKCRTTYAVMSNLLEMESTWVHYFEDETMVFLLVDTPVGRVQVYKGQVPMVGGWPTSLFEFRDPSIPPVPAYFHEDSD